MIKLYNTATRKKEILKPIKKDKVGIYTCGPTVYNYAHLGNLRAYVFADVLKRTLEYNGLKVKQVMNITDVGHLTSDEDTGEDKMDKGAKREKKTVWQIAKFYTDQFKKDLALLNIEPPEIYCKASDHIKEMIELIKKLEKKGYTYEIPNDGIYFDTSKYKDYAKFAKLDLKGLKAGARVKMAKGKKNITDFALWKFSPKDKKRIMEWDSPWGKGFPGWHIECSAMSTKYLGDPFDIHTGGIDHIRVHHTNEIAQSKAAGYKFANIWMHNDWLVYPGGEKMAKSGKGFLILANLAKKFNPLAFRYLLLNSLYRKQVEFTEETVKTAQNALNNLRDKIPKVKAVYKKGFKYETKFLAAINDDLNTPQALGVVWTLIKDEKIKPAYKKALLLKFDKVLGLGLDKIKKQSIPANIKKLSLHREKARKGKDWAKADKIRDEIEKKGYSIEDTSDGPSIKKI